MIRGVIFDLDGTLGDTLPVCYRAFARVLGRRLGRPFSDTEIHSMFGPSEEGILARLCPADPEGALRGILGGVPRGPCGVPAPVPRHPPDAADPAPPRCAAGHSDREGASQRSDLAR